MNLIVAVDKHWGIGFQGKLLVRIPNDHKFFREKTTGKVVVMGRKTLESFPQGQPLGNRTNLVLSTDSSYQVKGAIVLHSQEALLKELENYRKEDIYIIGGESIYKQLLPYCHTAYVTKIEHSYEADTRFPDLDAMPEWSMTRESEEHTYFDLEYRFLKYERSGLGMSALQKVK